VYGALVGEHQHSGVLLHLADGGDAPADDSHPEPTGERRVEQRHGGRVDVVQTRVERLQAGPVVVVLGHEQRHEGVEGQGGAHDEEEHVRAHHDVLVRAHGER
jgi:hypothetical protein